MESVLTEESGITTTTTTNNNTASESKKSLPHPGKFEDINRVAQEVLSTGESFDGFKCEIQGLGMKQFQFSHSFHLGSSEEIPKYALTTVYMDEKTAVAKIDSEGKVFARFASQFTNNLSYMSTINVGKELQPMFAGEVDYKRRTATASAKYDMQGNLTVNILQQLTKRISAGLEYLNVKQQGVSLYTGAARYNLPGGHSYALTVNNYAQLGAFYSFKKSNLELASQLEFAPSQSGNWQSKLSAGMRYYFRKQIFKLRVDTEGTVLGMYEENLTPQVKVCFCSTLNYFSSDFKFGIGLQLSR
eukprot:gene7027-8169_t